MADERKSNLEPIEEGDLDLKKKFTEDPAGAEKKNEGPATPELAAERKEGNVEKDAAYSKILSKVKTQSQSVDPADVAADAKIANDEQDAEAKISNLVNLAMQKGVPHAVKVARHLEDNYTLDEMHDRLLADELHEALVKKGLLKEV